MQELELKITWPRFSGHGVLTKKPHSNVNHFYYRYPKNKDK